MARIAVVGSVNVDMSLHVKRIPDPGETVIDGVFATAMGGKGANQAVAAARAGAAVSLIARVGKDTFGDEAVRALEHEHVDTRFVRRDPSAATGVAMIFVDAKGENRIGVASGANYCLSVEDVLAAEEVIASADALLLQLEIPLDTVEAAAKVATAHKVPVILNPAPACALLNGLLKQVSVITPNKGELQSLTGIAVRDDQQMNDAVANLQAEGVETVIVTLGPRGLILASQDGTHHYESHRVKALDSTAAGDVFSGTLSAALAEGQSLPAATRFANAAAALSVTRAGAQPSIPKRSEIDQFLREEDGRVAKKVLAR